MIYLYRGIYVKKFKEISNEIINEENYIKMKNYIAHSNITVYDHCYSVALASYKFVKKYKIKCDIESLIRAALLHDFYLYDWHDSKIKLHGFKHHRFALLNSKKYFKINKKEKNIIYSHRFPLTLWTIPKYKEALIVSTFDKIIAFKETFNIGY